MSVLQLRTSGGQLVDLPLLNGKDGRGIKQVDKSTNGYLQITYTDGTIEEIQSINFNDIQSEKSDLKFATPFDYGYKAPATDSDIDDMIDDNTAAILECIKNNNVIYFPRGRYTMNKPIIIDRSNVHLIGDFGMTSSQHPDDNYGSTTLVFQNCDGIVFQNGVGNNWFEEQTRWFYLNGINLTGAGATGTLYNIMDPLDTSSGASKDIYCAFKVASKTLHKFQINNCMLCNWHVGITDNFRNDSNVTRTCLWNGSFNHMMIKNTEYAIHLGWTHALGFGHFGLTFNDIYIDGGKIRLNDGQYNFIDCNFGIRVVDMFDFGFSFRGNWENCNFECDYNLAPIRGVVHYNFDGSEKGIIGGTVEIENGSPVTEDIFWCFRLVGVSCFSRCGFAIQGYEPLTFFKISFPRAVTFIHCNGGVVNRKTGKTLVGPGGDGYPSNVYEQMVVPPINNIASTDDIKNWIYRAEDSVAGQGQIWENPETVENIGYVNAINFIQCIDMDLPFSWIGTEEENKNKNGYYVSSLFNSNALNGLVEAYEAIRKHDNAAQVNWKGSPDFRTTFPDNLNYWSSKDKEIRYYKTNIPGDKSSGGVIYDALGNERISWANNDDKGIPDDEQTKYIVDAPVKIGGGFLIYNGEAQFTNGTLTLPFGINDTIFFEPVLKNQSPIIINKIKNITTEDGNEEVIYQAFSYNDGYWSLHIEDLTIKYIVFKRPLNKL